QTNKQTNKQRHVSEEGLHREALEAYGNHDWNKACLRFLELCYLSPKNMHYPHNIAMVLQYGFQNYNGAEKYFKQAMRLSINFLPSLVRHYCSLLSVMKRYDSCQQMYTYLFRQIDQHNHAQTNGENNSDEDDNDNDNDNDNGNKSKQSHEYNGPPKYIEKVHDDHLNYAEALMECEMELEESELHFKKALEIKPKNFKTLVKYGKLLSRIGKFDEAQQMFETAMELNAQDLELQYEYANVLWNRQEYEKALLQLQRALPKRQHNGVMSAIESQSQTQVQGWREWQEKLALLCGIILEEKQEYDEAEYWVTKAIEMGQPNVKSFADRTYHDDNENKILSVQYLTELMLIKIKKKEFEHALQMYQLAKSMLCTYCHGRSNSHWTLHCNCNPNDDDEDRAYSSDWYLTCVYALFCSETNRVEKATSLFRRLVSSEDNKSSPCYLIHFYFAMHLHYICKKFLQAKHHYLIAIKIESNWAITYLHFAMCLFQLQEYETAKCFALRAEQLNSTLPIIVTTAKPFVDICGLMLAQ
ncbi:TPR repeat-containing protein, partial [Reticulomyxa filosa]